MTARDAWSKLPGGLQRGDEVLAYGEWYPVIGYSLICGADTTGNVFTDKPYGKYEPWLGYRINVADIIDVRRALPDGGVE